MKNVQISLPDDLARDAAEAGLLDSEALQAVLRDCLRKMEAEQSNERELVSNAGLTSTPSFAKIWNNSDDDVYDAL